MFALFSSVNDRLVYFQSKLFFQYFRPLVKLYATYCTILRACWSLFDGNVSESSWHDDINMDRFGISEYHEGTNELMPPLHLPVNYNLVRCHDEQLY